MIPYDGNEKSRRPRRSEDSKRVRTYYPCAYTRTRAFVCTMMIDTTAIERDDTNIRHFIIKIVVDRPALSSY
jgi:hypothetical protein